MENVIIPLLLDMSNKQLQQTVAVKQYDTARTFHITLTDGGKPYVISSECYAVFTALKPDGNVILNSCSITDNTVIYAFTAQTTAAAGIMPCEIRLYSADNALITSPKFFMRVGEAVYGGNTENKVESSNEYNALTKLMTQANLIVSRIFTAEAETGAEGAPADVKMTYDSGTNTVTYKFTLPKGGRGDKGERGEQGVQGERGFSALWLRPEHATAEEEMPEGYYVELDPNGTSVDFDDEPTENSENLLSSGATYKAMKKLSAELSEKELGEEIRAKIDANTEARHTHANKTALDDITGEMSTLDIIKIWNEVFKEE